MVQQIAPAISDMVKQKIATDDNHPLKHFSVIFEQPVAWGDMDAFQHVNNVMYFEYSQSARIHYLQQLNMFDKSTFTVLAAASCQYLRPVVFPDTLWIGIRAKKIGNTSVTQEYVYYSVQQQAVVATAETVIVYFDEQGIHKQAITDSQKAEMIQLEAQSGHQLSA